MKERVVLLVCASRCCSGMRPDFLEFLAEQYALLRRYPKFQFVFAYHRLHVNPSRHRLSSSYLSPNQSGSAI